MLCISTKERKHVNQSKRRRPPIEINLQIYRYRSESESVRSPSRKDEHTLYRLPACVRCSSSRVVIVIVIVIVIVTVMVIVQIHRTRRSHENDLASARERKNKSRCRVYTPHCSCWIEKSTPLHRKRNCAGKTFIHAFSLQQDEITLYIFNTSRTVFTAPNKQKLRASSGKNPFKCHEGVLFLQPMIPPTRFDFFPLTGGCSEGLGAFRFFFKQLV